MLYERPSLDVRSFREVGVEWGVKKLGLKIRPDQVWGAGKALPKNWYA